MTRFVRVSICLICLSACSPPQTTVDTVDDKPHLQFAHASPTAVFSLDGNNMGPVASYDGKKQTLSLQSGMHHIEIIDGSRPVLTQDVYLGPGVTKTIDVGGL